ncbi:hypothetical protein [Dyella mobilis]|uniref:Uncharacterized protein n=1 Tax=Dyella mobilis TaxID=1849582 RepID=A0ABS2KCE3_9GAMM|nr:hypothetical protein [Dyella mobilis]MBM7128841.1 hypothetical protein [Dyella mobilis]GLQ99172.1 hypothetical protein GCM10007863_35920 [Dyella mobilis]
MRSIPVNDLWVTVTAVAIRGCGAARWRGQWSVYLRREAVQGIVAPPLARGETDLYAREENAYLFAGAEGVEAARKMSSGCPSSASGGGGQDADAARA